MTVEKKKILWAVSHLGERETPFVRRMEEAGFEVIRNPLGRLYKEEELTETASATPQEVVEVPLSVSGRTRKQRWARLIKQVYEAVPLPCPRCGGGMRILAFIEPACADTCLRRSRDRQAADRQPEVIDLPVPTRQTGKILTHLPACAGHLSACGNAQAGGAGQTGASGRPEPTARRRGTRCRSLYNGSSPHSAAA